MPSRLYSNKSSCLYINVHLANTVLHEEHDKVIYEFELRRYTLFELRS